MKNFTPAFLTAAALALAGFANLGFADRFEVLQTNGNSYSSYLTIGENEVASIIGFQTYNYQGNGYLYFKNTQGIEKEVFT